MTKHLSIEEYNYDLPENRIALHALKNRDQSKLLVYNKGTISHKQFYNLPDLLSEKAHLVFNNSKVVAARLLFEKETGALIEIFCLHPHGEDLQSGLMKKGKAVWEVMVGNKRKWKAGQKLVLNNGSLNLELSWINRNNNIVEFEYSKEYTMAEVLDHLGRVPLPPYLKRPEHPDDKNRYQTVYAKIEGAVAAPTAGLHFTEEVISNCKSKGIMISETTLHVGAGTFKPVEEENALNHEMHYEEIFLSKAFLENLYQRNEFIIAVGTTSLRTLESIYWLAYILKTDKSIRKIDKFPYISSSGPEKRKNAIETVLNYMTGLGIDSLNFETGIYLTPSYKMRMIDGLITNFHLPKSTLLLLIASLIGDDWKRIYREALDNDYRFLSFGDSSLLIP